MRNLLGKLSKFNKQVQPYTHRIKELLWELKYLKFKKSADSQPIGVMRVDGRGYHGGMTDRFKGAISWWHYCNKNNLIFKLFYNYPFKLTDYIIPNEYDWRIDEKDIPDSIYNTRIFYARGEKGKRLEKLKAMKNVWYYGNIDIGNTLRYSPYTDDWGKAFKKLFKPSPLLEKHLKKCQEQVKEEYIAVVFRFQNLLGDFNESFYRTIHNQEERRNLIDSALNELENIYRLNGNTPILVTSDSINFLEEANRKDYVYIIEGKLSHMEFINEDAAQTQLKSFLDFYMISRAKKVYSVVIGDMYKSDFPVYAAKVGGIPFERIEISDFK